MISEHRPGSVPATPDPELPVGQPWAVSSGPTALGARRRLRALAARSWSPAAIEQKSGIPARRIDKLTRGRNKLSPLLAERIAEVYERLWDRDPPADTAAERDVGEAARAHAAFNGWAPPMAWDDDQIDRPDGQPAPGWKPAKRTTRRRVDLVEDAEYLRENDDYRQASVAQIAMRLGVSRDCLEQAYARTKRQAGRAADRDAQPEAEAC